MKQVTWLALCLAILVGLSACGEDTSPEENTGGQDVGADAGDVQEQVDVGPLDAESFETKRLMAIHLAECETAFNDCPNTVREEQMAERATNVEECVAQADAYVRIFNRADQINDNVTFDEDAARDCLETLIAKQRADVCYTPSPADLVACDTALQGTVTDGGACENGIECVSGYCDYDAETCEGACRPAIPVVGEGETCGYEVAECDASLNLVCDVAADDPDSPVCVKAGSRQEGETCGWWDACADGLVCENNECTTRPLRESGESCNRPPSNTTARSDNPCRPGLVCLDLDAQRNGTCGDYKVDGDPCTENDECQFGFYCDLQESICKTTKGEGETCDPAKRDCADGLSCQWEEDDYSCQTVRAGDTGPVCAGDGGVGGGL